MTPHAERRHHPDRRARPLPGLGFSLIELLVVISIIAILAGMLLPAVGLVRAQAKQLECANALRQIGIATFAYQGDHETFYPQIIPVGSAPFDGPDTYWPCFLAPYLGGDTATWAGARQAKGVLMGCKGYAATIQGLNIEPWTYGMNFALGPSNSVPYWRSANRVAPTSETLLASENGCWQGGGSGHQAHQLDAYWLQIGLTLVPGGSMHRGGNNIVWCDGHVAPWKNVAQLSLPPYETWLSGQSVHTQEVWARGYYPWSQ